MGGYHGEKEAENGDSVAQLALGLHYMNLENPKRDPAVALEWAQRAAQSGIPSATMLVGLIYLEGGNGVVRKPAEGLQLVKSAASQGCVEAMSVLGNLYSRGRLVPMDKSAALMWYRIYDAWADVLSGQRDGGQLSGGVPLV